MKRLINTFLLTIATSPLLAQINTTTLEYWFDRDIASRKSIAIDGSVVQELDVSQMQYGIHTLEMRVSDTNGKWSSPLLKFFVRNNPVGVVDKYEYRIDDDAIVQSGTMSDGILLLDIDVSSLRKGFHTLVYQVQYNTGRKSSPHLLHFVIPELEEGAGVIAAYEYWFNRGPHTRVDLPTPAPSVMLNDVIIAVEDVLPNSLNGYEFDAATELVTVDDNVFFGVQVFNADNRASVAATSETFSMKVPVALNMTNLPVDGKAIPFAAPKGGRMQGLKSETTVGDSLFYILSSEDVKADFYDADGQRLTAKREVDEWGKAIYSLEAMSACTYLLVYDASDILNEMTAIVVAHDVTGVDAVWATDAETMVHYNVSGQVIDARQPGIHIVRMSDGTTRKIFVK